MCVFSLIQKKEVESLNSSLVKQSEGGAPITNQSELTALQREVEQKNEEVALYKGRYEDSSKQVVELV